MGVYSTEAHPFGLVYEYAENLDLKQYLRKEPNVGGLKLVFILVSTHVLFTTPLTLFVNSWRE